MSQESEKIKDLQERLEKLSAYSSALDTEITKLRKELYSFAGDRHQSTPPKTDELPKQQSAQETKTDQTNSQTPKKDDNTGQIIKEDNPVSHQSAYQRPSSNNTSSPQAPKKKFDIEKLIGENLINKLGILITVIGVGIGAKYSIDNNLISPLTRIVLGYVSGLVLLGIGMKLKANYHNYSAVLVSGAMAIMYFITYFAYSFYGLLGQEIAFGLMVIFTIFTVLAALQYDREFIAFFGMICAYAVPFLLSDGSGNDLFFLSYIAIVNVGILFISVKKYWRRLFYTAFFFTWVIFFAWLLQGYDEKTDFMIAMSFLTLFFLMFYAIFLVYKIVNKKKFTIGDIVFMLLNSFIYFGIGYGLIHGYTNDNMQLAIFALGNAAIHYFVANLINSKKLADNNIFYLVVGLVITFITIAIPVALDGNWVTMIWAIEAALLFWIGRSRKVPFYEYLSYICAIIMLVSLISDWDSGYRIRTWAKEIAYSPSVFNATFLSSLTVIASLGFINWYYFKKEFWTDTLKTNRIIKVFSYILPVLFLGTVFFAFQHEIGYYFEKMDWQSKLSISDENGLNKYNQFNGDYKKFKSVWGINLGLIFFSILSFVFLRYIKKPVLGWILLGFNVLVMLSYLGESQLVLSELRTHYISQNNAEYYSIGMGHILIRYLSMLCFGALVWMSYRLFLKVNSPRKRINKIMYKIAEIALYLVGLWVASSELLHWMDFANSENSSGVALTILWGVYALATVAAGIWKSKKHLRILGFVIFGITLIKLIFFDLAHLSTIHKTIVLVSLGILLLITSFLYNKYTISDDKEETA